jgi:enoyl-CoA hydratase/carnithine racemase
MPSDAREQRSEAFREGVRAFLERRRAAWAGY